MEELAIKQMWQDYENKLEQSIQLNHKIIRELQTSKADNQINAFRRTQVAGVVFGALWTAFMVYLIVHTLGNPYFVVSVGAIAALNTYAVFAYIKHLTMLETVNMSNSITSTQTKLASIQASMTKIGRLMLLQTPFYCTFSLSRHMVNNADTTFWLTYVPITVFFVILTIYLYRTINYQNMHRKWVRKFIESFGGKNLIKAMEFLKDVEEYQR